MFESLKKPYALITLAIIVAVAFACFHSLTLTYILVLAFCGYKCWDFANQPIVRHLPGLSLFLLFSVLIICGLNEGLYIKEMERNGCHIVSGVVTQRYTTKGSKGRTNYHTIVEYEPRGGGLKTKDIGGSAEYHETTEGQHIIMAEPFCDPGRFYVLEFNPSEDLVARMRHGIYAKGSLRSLDAIQDDAEVRESFANFDKPGFFDFFKNHPIITLIVLVILASALSSHSDRVAVFSLYGGLALMVLLSMVTNNGLFHVGISCFFFMIAVIVRDGFAKTTKVRNEIQRNGGFITVGECYMKGTGKSRHMEASFTDAMGNERSESIKKGTDGEIIIAHSAFNDVDIICLCEYPSKELLEEYRIGKFIGPCSKITLPNAQEDEKVRSQYEQLYTPKE